MKLLRARVAFIQNTSLELY